MMSQGARRLLARVQLSRLAKRNMSGHEVPEQYKHLIRPNMDRGYPIPSQLYSEAYSARQAKYNKMLGASIAFFLSSIAFVMVNDTYGFLSPPPRKVNIPLDQLKF